MPDYVTTFAYQAAICCAPQFSPRTYNHFSVSPVTGAIGQMSRELISHMPPTRPLRNSNRR